MHSQPKSLVRANVLAMQGYVPGEQVVDCVKLNTNEPAWPASPRVQEALHQCATGRLRVYPSPRADALRAKAAEVYGVDVASVLAGNGSDDLLTILVRALVGEGELIATPSPTYGLYDTLAAIQNARIRHVPYGPAWELPEGLDDDGAKLVLISNPNNPSGTTVDRQAILTLAARRRAIVVVDEAYADFSGQTFLTELPTHPNLVVIRTFSKSYSLAGARLGLLFGNAALVAELDKVKDSYNVNAITQTLGIAALGDQAYVHELVERTLVERRFLESALTDLGFRYPESAANFLLVDVGSRERAARIYAGLKAKRILVRYWDKPRLDACLRITVGTREQNEALVAGILELM